MTTIQQLPTAAATTWQPAQPSSKPKKQSYDEDALIDAYLQGRQEGYDHGLSEMQRGITKLLKENANQAAAQTRCVLDYLAQHELATAGAYLKLTSWDDLNIMVLVQQESFLKPAFKEVYNLVYDIEDKYEQGDLTLTFSFAPYGEEFNKACLNADGFSLEYVMNPTTKKAKKSRK